MDRSALLDIQLETLFRVSQVLSHPCPLWETLDQVLRILHDHGELRCGTVSLVDPDSGALRVSAIHGQPQRATEGEPVRYLPGEGLLGMVLERGEQVVLPRIADEPRFLNRLRLYDRELPFIGVPIRVSSGQYVGVLAAQPSRHDEWLAERARFLEMVANLIARGVRTVWEVECERGALTAERDSLRRVVRGQHGFDSIVGHSQAMQQVFEQVRQVAKWNTTVLIRGESGTGKELVACAIHYNSPRAGGPLLKLNCAALPDNLLESELFGHEKGAFTGALNQRKGRFEQAHGGTLFLDEIGDISPTFQAKLLRVLQEGELERVGSSQTLRVDVRIIAATNRNLTNEIATGNFREDLFFRLAVAIIKLPPLRDRVEDFGPLCEHILEQIAARTRLRLRELEPAALHLLKRCQWPGNIRELRNTLEQACMLTDGTQLTANNIRNIVSPDRETVGERLVVPEGGSQSYEEAFATFERNLIAQTLRQCDGKVSQAAKQLGLGRATLYRKMATLGMPTHE